MEMEKDKREDDEVNRPPGGRGVKKYFIKSYLLFKQSIGCTEERKKKSCMLSLDQQNLPQCCQPVSPISLNE